jgi:hypothetical protein
MAFHVRDPQVDQKVRRFAKSRGLGLTEAIGVAVEEAELRREENVERRLSAMRAVVERVSKLPDTGPTIDKAFFDSLNDE